MFVAHVFVSEIFTVQFDHVLKKKKTVFMDKSNHNTYKKKKIFLENMLSFIF